MGMEWKVALIFSYLLLLPDLVWGRLRDRDWSRDCEIGFEIGFVADALIYCAVFVDVVVTALMCGAEQRSDNHVFLSSTS